jgi:DNA-binding beta-propeller fold protein YncE
MEKLRTAALWATLLAAQAGAGNPLVVLTSDFQTGSIALLAPGADPRVNLLTIHSDAVARYHQGRVYVINRLGQDNILVLDPGAPGAPLLQFSVGNGSNPQDIEFASEQKAYVSRHNSASLLVVDPRDGSSLGEIDLSAFADGDGLPELAEMALVGQRLYVACQRLDRDAGWVASESFLVAVDTATDQVVDWDPAQEGVQGLKLQSVNPGNLIALGAKLYVAQTGQYGVADGGVEVVDLDTGRSHGLAVSEAELQGDITALALVSPAKGYAVVSAADFSNSVRPLDLGSGQVGAPLEAHSGGYTPDIEVEGGRLVVADRGTFSDPSQAGLLMYDANTDRLIAGPIAVGLPPLSIAALADNPLTAVAEEALALPAATRLGAAYPNPFNAGTLIPLTLDQSTAPLSLVVYDALGRQVRTLAARALPAGLHTLEWDGRDDQGQAVGSGAYVVELRLGAWRQTRKLLLLK